MSFWNTLVIFLIYFPVSYAECNVSDCALLKDLECALYTTDSNEKRLNQAFFPPRKATSRYITVNYVFDTSGIDEIDRDNCSVTYIWSIGGFLLIQPPTIFQLTSLMFSYPTNNIDNITLLFPSPCLSVINTTGGVCSCAHLENGNMDILTQQLLQYSKFSNPEGIVRDLTSVAQALCVEDIELGYFKGANVTTYIAAKLVLPAVATVASVTALSNYYHKLTEKVTNSNDRPTIVGVTMTGIYLSLYIISVDVSAIYFYVANKTEYRSYPSITNSLSLQLVYYSFISECALSTIALLVATVLHTHIGNKSKPLRRYKSTCSIIFLILSFMVLLACSLAMVAYFSPNIISIIVSTGIWLFILVVTIIIIFSHWTTPTDFFLVWFIVVPLILGSAHIDYILVAWLTEPAKTTSVSILAIAIVFYLFALSRFLYKIISKLSSKIKRNCWKMKSFIKISNTKLFKSISRYSEGLKLFLTFILGFVGICFTSLQLAAFYLLPFPSIRLVDYLDNIFQISLVIFGGLITYKVISNKESDFSKFLKKFNNENEDSSQTADDIPSEPVKIPANLTIVVQKKVEISNAKSSPNILLGERKSLVVTFQHNQGNERTKIPISEVTMRPKWSTESDNWLWLLESSEIDFYLSPRSQQRSICTVLLKGSKYFIKKSTKLISSGLTADSEWFVIKNGREKSFLQIVKKSPLQDSCDPIPLDNDCEISLQIPVQCYIVDKSFLGIDKGETSQFNNSISVVVDRNLLIAHKEKITRYLLPCNKSYPISVARSDGGSEVSIDDETFPLARNEEVTIKRHSRSLFLKFSLTITNSLVGIKLQESDNHAKYLVLQWDRNTAEISLDHLHQDILIVALQVQHASLLRSPEITFDSQPCTTLESQDKEYTMNLAQHDDETSINFFGEENKKFIITSDLKYMEMKHVQSASFRIVNPVPTGLRLKHEPGEVKVTLESINKISTIQCPEAEMTHSMTIEAKRFIPPALLFFPLIKKWKKRNEFETAGKKCRKLAQDLVKPSLHVERKRKQSLP